MGFNLGVRGVEAWGVWNTLQIIVSKGLGWLYPLVLLVTWHCVHLRFAWFRCLFHEGERRHPMPGQLPISHSLLQGIQVQDVDIGFVLRRVQGQGNCNMRTQLPNTI